MTVKELIEKLQKLPKDMIVIDEDDNIIEEVRIEWTDFGHPHSQEIKAVKISTI